MAERAHEVVFRSRRYPASEARAYVFGGEFVQPLAVCSIPVMIAALVAMLTGRAPLPWMVVGFPVALALATVWTSLQMRRRTVCIRVRDEAVEAVSLWDLTRRNRRPAWMSVIDVRRTSDAIQLTLGHDARELPLVDWADPNALEAALRTARGAYHARIQETLSGRST